MRWSSIWGRRGLRHEYRPCAELDRDRLREMWELRRQFMDLKVPAEEDFAAFCKRFARGTFAWILWYEQRVVGFMLVELGVRQWRGESYVAIMPEYIFVDRAWHGHPAVYRAMVVMFARVMVYRPRLRRYMFGLYYPRTFVKVPSLFGEYAVLGDPDISDFAREAMEAYAGDVAGERFDRAGGVVTMATIPRETSVGVSRDPVRQAALARYERINPRWREGYCVVVMTPVNAGTVTRAARTAARRWMHSRLG